MKHLFLFLLLCHVSSAVKHSLKYFYTVSSGLPNIPEFVAVGSVDDVLLGSCDSDKKTPEAKQDCVEKQLQSDLQQFELYNQQCLKILPNFFKATIHTLTQRFNQSGGVHVLQVMSGCEWDDETGEIDGLVQYGYDGVDLISFDLKTLTWITPKPQAVSIKLNWDADKARIKNIEIRLTQIYPQWLKTFLAYGESSLLRTDLPSVSLLQKTPSSPVSCHATGFYPERATLSWRKDGEELHEDVELGEILPNHDGTFQMSAELNLSSVTPEDWSRYTCVFQLSGVKEEIVTKLDKADIRTNEGKTEIKRWETHIYFTVTCSSGFLMCWVGSFVSFCSFVVSFISFYIVILRLRLELKQHTRSPLDPDKRINTSLKRFKLMFLH
uniref:major histocompatibility complex class I-related gene protein-like isoform X5 n=1 Tax=Scatophagus argus TaxID=75038 RepID=UPI001ED8255C|nr:major histocompatibility complex class I-related gene protein-like isoform X5 [Scatophagus argus]